MICGVKFTYITEKCNKVPSLSAAYCRPQLNLDLFLTRHSDDLAFKYFIIFANSLIAQFQWPAMTDDQTDCAVCQNYYTFNLKGRVKSYDLQSANLKRIFLKVTFTVHCLSERECTYHFCYKYMVWIIM